jgi:hypothetical protein
MSTSLKKVSAAALAALAVLMAACGGDDAGVAASSSGAGPLPRMLPTVWTAEGRPLNSCSLSAACSGNPNAPFFASASMAPADGATLGGILRIEVHGNEMQNVELLPASGYLPRLGVFNITGDKTLAWLDVDTTALPNGPLGVRVSAFNVAAGQAGGTEIVAMSARTWNINNAAPRPTTFTAAATAAPANGAVVSGTIHLELHGTGISSAELLPASGYSPRFGMFNVSPDRTMAWLDFDTRSVPDGATGVRVSAYNVTEGQPGASEIVAMPARQWTVSNGSASVAPFTATVTMAPMHGEIVSGRVRLEVRGTGMKNVELLPASGYAPRLGVFTLDGPGNFAWLELDTASLQNGVLTARIGAFNVASGQPNGREITAMPARQWVVQH